MCFFILNAPHFFNNNIHKILCPCTIIVLNYLENMHFKSLLINPSLIPDKYYYLSIMYSRKLIARLNPFNKNIKEKMKYILNLCEF